MRASNAPSEAWYSDMIWLQEREVNVFLDIDRTARSLGPFWLRPPVVTAFHPSRPAGVILTAAALLPKVEATRDLTWTYAPLCDDGLGAG